MIGKMAHTVQDGEAEGRMVHMIAQGQNGTQERSDFVERSDRHTAEESLSGEKIDRHILQERSDFVW